MPYKGACFRFYTQMRVEKNPKHLHIEFIVSSHNSVTSFPKMVTPHIGVPLKPKICSSAARFDLRNINETGIKYLNWTSKMILSQHNCCCCNKDRWWSFWHFARKTVFGCLLRAARHTKLCLISLKNILLIVLMVVQVASWTNHTSNMCISMNLLNLKF